MTHPPQSQSQEQEQPTNEPLSEEQLALIRPVVMRYIASDDPSLSKLGAIVLHILDTATHYRERAERAEKALQEQPND